VLDRLISPRAALRRATRLTQQGKLRRAFLLLSRAAQAGLAEAEYRVGRCYLEGGGVPPSRADGLRWLGRAAAHGYVEAQSLLAMLLIQGTAAPLAPTLEPGARPAAALFAANAGRILTLPSNGLGLQRRAVPPTARRCSATS
jgi:TPR repeat protein